MSLQVCLISADPDAGAVDEPPPRGAAVALGNMDGVHIGHQAVIGMAARAGARLRAPLAAAIFEPHPRRLFQPDAPPFRLQSPAQRTRALQACGVEIIYQIAFDRALAALTDTAFCETILSERMGAAHVVVGEDFRFGRNRMGGAETLVREGERLGFSAEIADAVDDDHTPGKVSSSAIRAALVDGDPQVAARLLGRPWAIEGVVGPGAQRGRTIGVPTANVALGDYLRPRFGVYAATCDVGDGIARPAVVNIGVKPTVGGAAEPLLEAHLFDFSSDLYGKRIETALHAFIRPERKFESFEALMAQIKTDAEAARLLLRP